MFAETNERLVNEMAANELNGMNLKYGTTYHSPHEFYGVIREEIDELKTAVENVDGFLEKLWEFIKVDEPITPSNLKDIRFFAVNAAMEAAQIVAVLDKERATILKEKAENE